MLAGPVADRDRLCRYGQLSGLGKSTTLEDGLCYRERPREDQPLDRAACVTGKKSLGNEKKALKICWACHARSWDGAGRELALDGRGRDIQSDGKI